MSKNLFPILAALILAAPAHAGVVAPAGASAHAWVAPVAGVFSSVGAQRIATLGSPSLTALSTLDSSSRYSFAAAPQVLDLLAKNLKFYATPEAFAAMPVEDKIIALRAAAKGAEIEAAAIADESLAAAKSRPLHPSSADAISKQVAVAEAVSLYLDAPRREEAARMRSRVASFQSKWRKLVEKFREELPLMIASDAFDAGNILVKTKHGWVAADESPYPIEADLSKFYARRIAALKSAPRGPWSRREAEILYGALDHPDVNAAFPGETAVFHHWPQKVSALDARITLQEFQWDESHFQRGLRPAIEAFKKNAHDGSPVAARHILAVEKRYADLLDAPPAPSHLRLRILAAMRNGAAGLPSWERFREIERSTHDRYRRTAMIAAGVLVAGMIVMMALGGLLPAMPLAAKLAALSAAWLAPLIVFVRNLWLAQSLESARDHSPVDETLRRAFPND
ncbi:MAG: hypothetical protein PHS14_15765 [Elusimicrobia bacterium]|nr:hypothetical protein [Elusimicrobiota bacterium]